MEEFETPNNGETSTNTTPDLQNPNNGETITAYEHTTFYEDFDSACSTPYVSAPSSPGRGPPLGSFFYSAPASPVHFVLSKSNLTSLSTTTPEAAAPPSSVEFEFSARYTTNGSTPTGSMSSADELFLNGKIRPMKLSSHLLRPQALSPLLDLDEINGGDSDGSIDEQRGRDLKFRNRSLRRRTRSMSPLRNTSFQWHEEENENESNQNMEIKQNEAAAASETTPSGSSSRSSSVGRSSKRWVFLKEFLYRSKSEGRNNGNHKFWSSLSFSPVGKDKKISTPPMKEKSMESKVKQGGGEAASKKVRRSAHELHYTANRAQSEEMRKKTFLPYRQGLLGCLGFSSKSYGAMNGFARALNPVSSR